MKLWGRTTSINVQKALWALDEAGATYEQIDVGGAFGGLDTPAFLKLNPNGLIPVLEDGETVVFESNAIVRYVAAAYAEGTLWDRDPGRRARSDQWMEWSNTTIYPLMITCFFQCVRYRPERRDPEVLQAAADELARHLAIIERHLAAAQTAFVAGERITIGDIAFGAHLYRYYEMPLPRPVLPALSDYYARLTAREAYGRRVMVSFESLVGTM